MRAIVVSTFGGRFSSASGEAAEAYRLLESRKVVGKMLLSVD